MDFHKIPSPVYEGDIIVLSCQDAAGYFFSLPPRGNPSSSYSSVNIHPDSACHTSLNVQCLQFKILPDNEGSRHSYNSPVSSPKEHLWQDELQEIQNKFQRPLCLSYGRKIKLFHVISQKFLSFKDQTDSSHGGRIVLDPEPHVFRILPSNGNRIRGDTVFPKDDVILESVKNEQYVLAFWDSLFESFHFKLAATKSVFTILSRFDSKFFQKDLRSESIITFYNRYSGTYLSGSDCTDVKVYAKKKKFSSVSPLFVSSDCWWQLENLNHPLNGSPLCYIKHVLTQKYLAVSPTNNVKLILNKSDSNVFHVNVPSPRKSNNVAQLANGSTCFVSTNASYLSIDESKCKATHTKIGSPDSIEFELCLRSDLTGAGFFKVDQVNHECLYRLHRLDNVKYILVKSLEKIKRADQTTIVNLKLVEHTLDSLFLWLINENTVTAKNYVKMLRANQCLQFLVDYLDLDLEKMDQLLKSICKILKAVAKIKSHKSHLYLARKSFMNVYIKKLGKGVGIEDFLIELTGDESSIAQSLTDILFPSVELHIWKKENLDASTLKLLSKLCFVDGTPDKDLQDSICDKVIKNDKLKNIFFCIEEKEMPTLKVKLFELCSSSKNIDDEHFNFFLAQISLFSSVCKGLNKNPAIAIVSRWFPCEVVLSVLNNEVIHIKAKSAFLELIVSVYLDEIIIESGTDIDNIWTYYLLEELQPMNILEIRSSSNSVQDQRRYLHVPLKGANVQNYMTTLKKNKLEHYNFVQKLIEIVQMQLRELGDHNECKHHYVDQLLSVIQLLFAYGFCWNVDEVTFSVQNNLQVLKFYETVLVSADERVMIYKIEVKIIKLLKIFFKQFIYLYAEQIICQFHDSDHDSDNQKVILENLIEQAQKNIKELCMSQFIVEEFDESKNSRRNKYQLKEYQIFDVETDDGRALTSILEGLTLSRNDELKTISAGLLYDIHNQKQLVLDQVELAYIVTENSFESYSNMFTFCNLEALRRNNLWPVNEIIKQDETVINTSAQNIALSCGIFAMTMQYVLRFCPTIHTKQQPFLQTYCRCLQIICRGNPRSQKRIAERLNDFLKVKTGVFSVACLLTEVFTNNENLCKAVSHWDISQIFHLASSKQNEIEYIAFFTTLEAIMMPSKLTAGHPLKTVQGIVIKHFSEAHADFYKTIDKIKILKQKTEDQGDDFVKLLKLLHLTDLMATCCIGQIQSAEDICHNSVTLNELINIVTNENIPQVRKIPFVRLIIEGYLQTERESVRSLHALAHTKAFWTHVYHFSTLIKQLSWSTQAERVYFKRILMFYQTWKQTLLKENEALHNIQYFIEGLGPLLIILCQGNIKLTDIEYAKMALEELEKVLVKKKKFLLSTKSQTNFWQNFFDSISSVTSTYRCIIDLDEYSQVSTTRRPSEDPTGQKLSELTTESPSPTDDSIAEDEKEKINNEKLQNLITKYRERNVGIESHDGINNTNENASSSENVSSVVDLLHSFYNQLHQKAMTSVEKARLHSNTLTTIKTLYKRCYRKTEELDILQKRLECGFLSDTSFSKLLFKLLLHPSDDIFTEILELLYILIDKTTQNAICKLLVEDRSVFLKIHQLMTTIIEDLNGLVVVESRPHHFCISIEEDWDVLNENTTLPNFLRRNSSQQTDLKLNERGREYLGDMVLILNIIAELCDGQNRKVQNLMKEQPHVESVNIISDTTTLLLKLASKMPSTYEGKIDDIFLKIMIMSIQALIEMCTGNYINQQVAVQAQVVDSINLILNISLEKKVHLGVQLVQCKSIELLQILLEKTNVKSFEIIHSISSDINKENVVKFIKYLKKNGSFQKKIVCHKKKVCSHSGIDEDELSTCIKGCITVCPENSMRKAYCIWKYLADFTKEKSVDDEFADLEKDTCHIEINHITEDGSEILTRVYFPFESSRQLTDDEKEKMQDELERDSHEEKLKDLLKWTDSVWKNDQHKRKFNRCLKVTNFYSDLRHWTLILLTVILNILILGLYRVPSAYNCSNSTINNGTEGYVTVPQTWECWSVIEYILLYVLGALHCILAIWMVIEYFIKEGPNFKPDMPLFKEDLFKQIKKYKKLKKICDWINDKPVNVDDKSEGAQYFDIYLFGLYTMYRVLFVISSILGLATWGYFYCLCLPYSFIKFNVILHVVKALKGIATQLILVALLILSILLIYAVLSFAFMTSFFDVNNNLYCRNLWECYVTVIREGLVNSFGGAIPVTYAEQSGSSFNIYFWRSIIDVSFFVIISIIGLEIVTALLVNRFSELREKKDKAKLDQKQVCFICNISSDSFQKKEKGFPDHYRHDHNMYNYIYYIIYVKSLKAEDRNAIEKYVYEREKHNSIKFFPINSPNSEFLAN